MDGAFAVWITGLPASGKSTLAAALRRQLAARGVGAVVLESDVLREILTPGARYDETERDAFYGAVARLGHLLAGQGVPVIFDATANLRRYRDAARRLIPRFLEVYVECPLRVCEERDPKGIYRRGRSDPGGRVPGLQAAFEPPERPDVTHRGDRDGAEDGARRVVAALDGKGWLDRRTGRSAS